MIVTELSTFQAAVVTLLVAVGSFFLLVGTVGLVRLPNVYNRMHATSKATTLGAASLFLAGAIYFSPVLVSIPVVGSVPVLPEGAGLISLVGIVFLFATAPTGAHVVSRSARKMGISFVEDVRWPDEASTEGSGADSVVADGDDRANENGRNDRRNSE